MALDLISKPKEDKTRRRFSEENLGGSDLSKLSANTVFSFSARLMLGQIFEVATKRR